MRCISSVSTRMVLSLAASAALFAAPARAQFIWSNGAGGNWSIPGNWGGSGPAAGGSATTTLTFGPNGPYTATNDFNGAFTLNQLNFNHASGLVTLAQSNSGSLNFDGTTPQINYSGAGSATVNMPINFAVGTTIQGNGTGTLNLTGALTTNVTGATGASLTANMPNGVINLSGGGTFTDGTTADTGGYLAVNSGTVNLTGGVFTAGYATTNNNLSALSVQNGTALAPTHFNVSNGATFSGAVVFFGRLVNSNVQATVSGFGSSVSSTGQFTVGSRAGAVATLTVSNGGSINPGSFSSGLLETSMGTTTITGIDGSGNRSTMTVAGQLSLGGGAGAAGGVGILNIQNGGLFQQAASQNAFLGVQGANSIGRINVDGVGPGNIPSTLNIANQFTIGGGAGSGAAGSGQVFVTNGGVVNVGGTNILNQDAAGSILSTVSVSGAGSQWNVTGQLQMSNGPSTFTVQSGAVATITGIPFLATAAGSSATLTISGTGATFTTPGQLTLSGGGGTGVAGGTAIMNVNTNATASAGLTILGQSDTSGSATMNVDTGGTFTGNGQFQVAPTAGGVNTVAVNVTGGGTVTINESAFFAISTASTATLTVTGANSVFQTTGTGQIQFGGSGSTAGGTTTVNIGTGGVVRTSSDPSTLVAIFSPATVNVNSGGTLQSPNVNVDGRLIANGAVNGAVTVNTGGFLGGTSGISGSIGTITGNVNVNSGATIRPGDGSSTGAGILTVAGAGSVVTVASGGTFSLNVNGPTPGNGANNHGQLLMTGGATINITGSTLQTTLGYAPNPGQVVTFITGGGVTGTFNGLPENQLFQVGTFNAVNYFANIHYTSNSVFFTVVPEPMHILGLGAMVCGGFTWWKKRRNTKATLAA